MDSAIILGPSVSPRYISERERNPEREEPATRSLFNDGHDRMKYKRAATLLKPGGVPLRPKEDLHHLIISPKESIARQLDCAGTDRDRVARKVARLFFSKVAKSLGVEPLNWCGGAHRHTKNLHLHFLFNKKMQSALTGETKIFNTLPKDYLNGRDADKKIISGKFDQLFSEAFKEVLEQEDRERRTTAPAMEEIDKPSEHLYLVDAQAQDKSLEKSTREPSFHAGVEKEETILMQEFEEVERGLADLSPLKSGHAIPSTGTRPENDSKILPVAPLSREAIPLHPHEVTLELSLLSGSNQSSRPVASTPLQDSSQSRPHMDQEPITSRRSVATTLTESEHRSATMLIEQHTISGHPPFFRREDLFTAKLTALRSELEDFERQRHVIDYTAYGLSLAEINQQMAKTQRSDGEAVAMLNALRSKIQAEIASERQDKLSEIRRAEQQLEIVNAGTTELIIEGRSPLDALPMIADLQRLEDYAARAYDPNLAWYAFELSRCTLDVTDSSDDVESRVRQLFDRHNERVREAKKAFQKSEELLNESLQNLSRLAVPVTEQNGRDSILFPPEAKTLSIIGRLFRRFFKTEEPAKIVSFTRSQKVNT